MSKNNLSQTQKLKIAQWMAENHDSFIANKMSCPMVAAAAEKHFSDYKMVITANNIRAIAKALEWTEWPTRDKATPAARMSCKDSLGEAHFYIRALAKDIDDWLDNGSKEHLRSNLACIINDLEPDAERYLMRTKK